MTGTGALTRRQMLATAAASMAARVRPAQAAPREDGWLAGIYRELHVDAHFGQVPQPYEDFDAEAAAAIFKDAGFQMVSYFAVCNAGYSYYPTKIGVEHPGLKRDFTGEMTAALKKRGIRVLAYVSAGPDRRHGSEHPEWLRAAQAPAATGRGSAAQMCLNSPWVEQVHIPQLQELVSLYDVDGFFLDGLIGKFIRGACYCRYCREAFGAEIPTADNDPKVFAHYQFLSRSGARYAERVIGALQPAKPGLAIVFNHIWVTRNPVTPPAAVTQLVWEPAPPYTGTLSLDFSLEARYLSSQPGIANWSCMTTRGNGWGDYSLRDTATFRHEAAVLLAGGGRPYFGDDSYPSGNPDPAVYKVYGDVNRRTAALEPFLTGFAPVKDIAVLLSADSIWSRLPLNPPRDWMNGPSSPGTGGAHKALAEGHTQFAILNSDLLAETLAEYRALVLAEQTILSARECDAIRRFVESGGALIATGDTGTRDSQNRPLDDFALADMLGVRNLGRADARRAFLRSGMDVQVSGAYQRIQTTTAAVLLPLVAPVGGKQAPAAAPEGPGITINRFGKGQALYCAAPLFGAYQQFGTPALRSLAWWMLDRVHPAERRVLSLENVPTGVEATCHARGEERLVHLVSRAQEFIPVEGIRIRLESAARPRRISAIPEREAVGFQWKNGYIEFVGRVSMHSAYWIEA